MTNALTSPMNKICRATLFLIAVIALDSARAQDDTNSYFRLANATGLDGKVHFHLDGEDLNPDGYISGETTGSLGVAATSVRIKASHLQCEDAEQTFQLTPGQQTAIIVYIEPEKDSKTGEIKKRLIKFSTLDRKADSKKRTATLLFLSVSQSIEVKMNNSPINLTALKQSDIAFGDSRLTGVNITVAEKKIGDFDIEDPGDYAVIVFDKADGTHGCISFYNSRH